MPLPWVCYALVLYSRYVRSFDFFSGVKRGGGGGRSSLRHFSGETNTFFPAKEAEISTLKRNPSSKWAITSTSSSSFSFAWLLFSYTHIWEGEGERGLHIHTHSRRRKQKAAFGCSRSCRDFRVGSEPPFATGRGRGRRGGSPEIPSSRFGFGHRYC